MNIEFKDRFKIQQVDVQCKMNLPTGKLSYLAGENGVGKSSLIQFFKLNQAEFFPEKKIFFVDQLSLKPLNEISYAQLEIDFAYLRTEELACYDILNQVILPYKHLPIRNLSGGQNQLIKIALALYLSADIFVFDEPLQYLDSSNVELFLKILAELKAISKTIFLVEHRMDAVRPLIDEINIMSLEESMIQVRAYGN